jgi:hypothetical protein
MVGKRNQLNLYSHCDTLPTVMSFAIHNTLHGLLNNVMYALKKLKLAHSFLAQVALLYFHEKVNLYSWVLLFLVPLLQRNTQVLLRP